MYGSRHHEYICGIYYLDTSIHNPFSSPPRKYLPPLSQSVHARIVASTSRTTLTQTFANPSSTASIPELRYNFPLYDGVSVVAFTCTINKNRVIRGVVQEKNTARKTYNEAVDKGQTAALFEQLPDASDVFTTTVGNVPPGAHITVEIDYLGELKHDAEVDGIRFTIPTSIAPRFGTYPGTLADKPTNVSTQGGITIVVDAEVPAGSFIKSIQSPSHPIAVSVGSTSTMKPDATPSLQLASATLSLGTAQLDDDFIIQVIATNTSNPVAVLETHPTIPHQQALMATLVPKFKLAPTKPEIVFICDRSGSMQGSKMDDLKNAVKLFLKSLPVGAMFNICSFGSSYTFLFDKSVTYDQNTLEAAMKHVDTFAANYGGTELNAPIQKTFELRHTDLDLEAFVITDGEVWKEDRLFGMVNDHVQKSKGAIRLFTLGVGRDVSHSLIEGLARAGNGFSQAVSENEKMSAKMVRMLKGALTPHVNDYTLELKYADAESETEPEDDFEIIESATATLPRPLINQDAPGLPKKPISLFDSSADDDVDMEDKQPHVDGTDAERYSHVPAVKPPKVLRAPFQIPPLFPFSRTTVYLILSPDRELKAKVPESLILRGTSPQGPLELQIPITILQDKAETIHQLAARKAVKELEEGRGWIFHAKAKDGQSLKDKHPGRFPSMVEREAVRLGIQFQVGGKWCSFVAVDNDPSRVASGPTEDELRVAAAKNMSLANAIPQMKKKKVGMRPPAYQTASISQSVASRPGAELFSGNLSMSRSNPPLARSIRSNFNSLFGGSASASASQPPAGGSLFGGPASTSSSQGTSLFGGLARRGPPGPWSFRKAVNPDASPPQSGGFFGGGSLFGSGAPSQPPPSPLAAPALAPPAAQVDEALLEKYRNEMNDAACMPLPEIDDDDAPAAQQGMVDFNCMGFTEGSALKDSDFDAYLSADPGENAFDFNTGRYTDGSRLDAAEDFSAEFAHPPQTLADKFSALVSMQEFSGYWVWSAKLFAVLGISSQDVMSTADKAFQGTRSLNVSSTAAVVAFMRKRLADERDSWEMMVEKAVTWLEAELGDESAKLLAALEPLFQNS
ncbi:putative vault protein inter-alpha-trypsin [Colletotrichum sublineola]|uniref:Putative vault protein inter-alpha-trypsin n=1 Tax=Colletotrichum sublineola TaxID=1173701 RepID=A0A066XYA7_COLSU|nr:putative vault protein inter-alpha-trypsin [Colletotrichum sublineola]